MFDPEELNAKIARSHINAEKVEEEAKALENKILENYEVKKDMLPPRAWGQPYDPSKFSMSLKFLIEKHQPEVASYLGFNSGYHSRQAEIEEARKEAVARMAEQTEKLREKNQENKLRRERDILWNQTHSVTQRRSLY